MLKRILVFVVLAVAIALGALSWTFMASDLPVPQSAAIAMPPPMTTPGVTVNAIMAGKMFSKAGMAFRGGSLGEDRIFNMGGFLVQHPKGTLLFDSGLGRNIDSHVDTVPWLMRKFARLEKEPPVADQLRATGITLTSIFLTHAHWDHVSGVQDFPGIPVMVPQAELDFVASGGAATELARRIGTQDYKVFDFEGGPYLGFDRSHDVFGDGSVVLVLAPGHTPGSIFAFITASDGARYVLIGDTAWQSEGVDRPAEKPWLLRRLVDHEPERVRGLLVKLHQLKVAIPGLIVVPAHDRRVWEHLPGLAAAPAP